MIKEACQTTLFLVLPSFWLIAQHSIIIAGLTSHFLSSPTAIHRWNPLGCASKELPNFFTHSPSLLSPLTGASPPFFISITFSSSVLLPPFK